MARYSFGTVMRRQPLTGALIATMVKTSSGTWKALILKTGWHTEHMTVAAALTRYLKEVTPTKRASAQAGEHKKAQAIIWHLGKYSLAALSAEIVAQFRDTRLAGARRPYSILLTLQSS